MVKETIKGKKKYYQCEACGFVYASKKYAQQCEDFCTKHKGCSLEITQHAIPIQGGKP